VFSFVDRAPKGSTTYETYDPIEHLNLWLVYQKYWCDHKPSVTIDYTDTSFLDIGQWIYNHWDDVSGISFMPADTSVYSQKPFEAITEEKYLEISSLISHSIKWSDLEKYEKEDTTISSHSLACVGGSCEVVDILGES
jgi:ribonucleoside-diphosphate reductase alpha chain